jgi:DNA replication protein DnaD
VSRITRDKHELKIQKDVVEALAKLETENPGISKFFNLADSSCIPHFKPEDTRDKCTVRALQGDERAFVNFITPVQGDTLSRTIAAKSKTDDLIKSSLKGVMLATGSVE